MTDKDVDMLAGFVNRAMQALQSVEVKQNFAGDSQIIFTTPHATEKLVYKFMVAAPINLTALITEVREMNSLFDKVLMKSIEEDGEPENGEGEVTKMLREFRDARKSIATTEEPEKLMGGEKKE